MKYTLRLLLQVYSPAGLSAGTTRELALFYFAVRMSQRFAFYRWLIGPPSFGMMSTFTFGSLTRGSLRNMYGTLDAAIARMAVRAQRPPDLN